MKTNEEVAIIKLVIVGVAILGVVLYVYYDNSCCCFYSCFLLMVEQVNTIFKYL